MGELKAIGRPGQGERRRGNEEWKGECGKGNMEQGMRNNEQGTGMDEGIAGRGKWKRG
jgi:hypothetical protein